MVNFLEGGFVMKSQNRAIALLMAVVMLASLLSISCLSISAEDATHYLNYSISNDEVTITGLRNYPVNLVIPETIDGYPVTKMVNCASNTLKSLVIPESVVYIGIIVASNLVNVVIRGCPIIEPTAFGSTGIYSDSTNWDSDGALYIGDCLIKVVSDSTGTYNIKPGTRTIAGWAFEDCKFSEVILPPSIKTIGKMIFWYFTGSMSSIEIPDGVERMSEYVFAYDWTTNLQDIYIYSRECEYYPDTDGVFTPFSKGTIHGYEGSTTEAIFAYNVSSAVFAAFPEYCDHQDADHDHFCDICGGSVGKHADYDNDHYCDYCGEKMSDCVDDDHDHHCDDCDDKISDCVDNDHDNYCDICGEKMKTSFKEIIAFLETLEFEDVDFSHDFYCKMCPLYFMHRDTAIIGPFIRLVHHFVHMGHFIGHVS